MKIISFLAVFLLLFAVAANCEEKTVAHDVIVKENLEVTAEVLPCSYMMGEPVFLRVTFRNVSGRQLRLGEVPYKDCRFAIEMTQAGSDHNSSGPEWKPSVLPKTKYLESLGGIVTIDLCNLAPNGKFTASFPLGLLFDMTNYHCAYRISVSAVIGTDDLREKDLSWKLDAQLGPQNDWRSVYSAGEVAAKNAMRIYGGHAPRELLDEAEKLYAELERRKEPEKSEEYGRLVLLIESIDRAMFVPTRYDARSIKSCCEWNMNGFRKFLDAARKNL